MTSFYVGQRATISTTVNGPDGPADATVTLTVHRPDGTVFYTGSPAGHPATGQYTHPVTFDMADDWWWVFQTTGTVVGTDVGQAHVIQAGLRVIGLADAKEHRNISSTANDRELLDFIGAAQKMLEDHVGPIVPVTVVDEVHHPAGDTIILRRSPVAAITAVQEYTGGAGLGVIPAGEYRLDTEAGLVHRLNTTGGLWWWRGSEVRITYVAGRRPIPENLRLAAKELVGHMWRFSQSMRGGGRVGAARGGAAASAEETAAAMGYALPNAVMEMIGPNLKGPAHA